MLANHKNNRRIKTLFNIHLDINKSRNFSLKVFKTGFNFILNLCFFRIRKF